MTRVFWDTNLFVYLFEGGEYAAKVRHLRARMLMRGDELVTSALTLGELLVKPRNHGEQAAVDHQTNLQKVATILPFDVSAARAYALIRRDKTIKAPHAIQLACAAAAQVDLFITNDDRLSKKNVAGVKFITSLEHAYL